MRRTKYPIEKMTPIERGEKKMTTDRAISWVNNSMCLGRYERSNANYEYFKDERHIAGEMAIRALEKQETLGWYDLKRFPDVLPKEDVTVIVFDLKAEYALARCEYWTTINNELCTVWTSEENGVFLKNVVAWKYIQPFKGGDLDE